VINCISESVSLAAIFNPPSGKFERAGLHGELLALGVV